MTPGQPRLGSMSAKDAKEYDDKIDALRDEINRLNTRVTTLEIRMDDFHKELRSLPHRSE